MFQTAQYMAIMDVVVMILQKSHKYEIISSQTGQ